MIEKQRAPTCPFATAVLPAQIEAHELRAVIENALEPFVSMDAAGVIVAWNPQAEATFGWTQAEAVGRHAADLIVPENLRELHRERLAHYRFGDASDVVGKRVRVPSRRSDGTPLIVELQVAATHASDGALRFHAFVHDITSLERARAEISRSERLLAEAQRIAHLGSYSHDLVSGAVVCSDELVAILGIDANDFDGTIGPLVSKIHRNDLGYALAAYETALVTRAPYDFEHRIVRPSGEHRIVRRRGIVLTDDSGRPIRTSATVHDVTEQRHADAARRVADARFTRSFEDSPFGLALIGATPSNFGRFVLVNDAFCRALGYESVDFEERFYRTIVAPADYDDVLTAAKRVVVDGKVRDTELRLHAKSGRPVWIRQHLSLMRDEAGEPLHFFAHIEDVTTRRAERAAFDEIHQRLYRSVEDAPIGMALASVERDALGPFREVNSALIRLTGYERDALLRKDLGHVIDPRDAACVAAAVAELLAGNDTKLSIEARSIRADGCLRWLSLHISLVRDGSTARYAIVQILDVTAAKQSEIHLEYLAHHDELTKLLNRRGFERRIDDYLGARSHFDEIVSILMIDVDYFKYVNDSFGHAAGDRVLAIVATTLQNDAGAQEFVARLGGDEFVIVMPGVANAAAIERAGRVREAVARAVDTQTEPHMHVTVSVGVATMDCDATFTIDDALAAADLALSTAKEEGRDRTSVAKSTADTNRTLRGRMEWARRIRSALAENRFCLYRQPILNLASRHVDRYEFLLRMLGDDGAIVMPALFLGEAERFGLLVDIDRWVITEAIRIVADASRAGETTTYEVNLSAASLVDEKIVAHVREELERTKLDPSLLIFELTETTAIGNMENAQRLIEAVAALGCRFALDDFGAGFSSFYYLKRLPFDYLKIDGEFIVNIVENEADRQIVRSIVSLARGLKKKTIAEFVGSARSLELLATYGVDFAQGYHIGKPEPVPELGTVRSALR